MTIRSFLAVALFLVYSMVNSQVWLDPGTTNEHVTIHRYGDVGININSPNGKLHVKGNVVFGLDNGDFIFTNSWQQGQHNMSITPNESGSGSTDWNWNKKLTFDGLTGELRKYVPTGTDIAFSTHYTGNDNTFQLFGNGNVRMKGTLIIGDVNTNTQFPYKLYVEDGIITEKLRVANKESFYWADFVFETDYKLLTLKEMDDYIRENGHLFGMPSAKEVYEQGGFEVGDITLRQQIKIEEIFLHLINISKKVEVLERTVSNLVYENAFLSMRY